MAKLTVVACLCGPHSGRTAVSLNLAEATERAPAGLDYRVRAHLGGRAWKYVCIIHTSDNCNILYH